MSNKKSQAAGKKKRASANLVRVDSDTKNKKPRLSESALVLIWRDVLRTIRWGIVGVSVVLAVGLVTWGAVAITATDGPWWKILLFTTVPPLSILGMFAALLRKRIKGIIDSFSTRNRTLEEKVDPDRTSSELLNDGTHRDD